MTAVETLRQAAKLMREQHGPDHPRHEFWHLLGNWLDRMANDAENAWFGPNLEEFQAGPLAVARAYLDGSS